MQFYVFTVKLLQAALNARRTSLPVGACGTASLCTLACAALCFSLFFFVKVEMFSLSQYVTVNIYTIQKRQFYSITMVTTLNMNSVVS